MIRNLLKSVLEPRHFWRDAGFSELNELYVSNLLRHLSISVLMIFVPIYLYKQGYSVGAIFCMHGAFILAALASLLIVSERFMAIRQGSNIN